MAWKKRIWKIVFGAALIVFVVSVGMLGAIVFTYWKADTQYGDVAAMAFPDAANVSAKSLADMTVDWSYLRGMNEDVVAWVYVPGTRINYPVVQTADNETYLHKSFEGEGGFAGVGGAIFMDAACAPDCSSVNTVIYGHHMNDGSMFTAVSSDWTEQESFDKAHTVYVFTPACNYVCEVFAVVRTTGSDAVVQVNFESDAAKRDYVQDKMDRSLVLPAAGFPPAEKVTQLFTLSTCDYAQKNGRAIGFARVVDTAIPRTGATYISLKDAEAVHDAFAEIR